MTGVRKISLAAALLVLLGLGLSQAETWTTTSTTVGDDGLAYTYTNTYDDASGVTLEKLVRTNGDGSTTVIAILRTDADGNWTGQIDGVTYEDMYSEFLGDYVVIQGADVWPTWEHFDAALWALPGWGGSDVIGTDPILIDLIYTTMTADGSSGKGGSVTSNHKLHGIENAMMRTSPRGSIQAGSVLFQLWAKGVGAPTPPAGSNAQNGK